MTKHATRAGLVGVADADRHPEDFYRTKPYATRALVAGLRSARIRLDGVLFDPCCGDGAIMDELARAGLRCGGSDIVFRGAGIGGVDFLKPDWRGVVLGQRPDWLIVNPPYRDGLPVKFLAKCLDEARAGVAFLLRHGWLPPIGERDAPCPRWDFIEDPRLALEIHVGRMSYLPPEKDKGGNGLADFVWLVFVQTKKRRGIIRQHYKRLGVVE